MDVLRIGELMQKLLLRVRQADAVLVQRAENALCGREREANRINPEINPLRFNDQ